MKVLGVYLLRYRNRVSGLPDVIILAYVTKDTTASAGAEEEPRYLACAFHRTEIFSCLWP